MLSKEILGQLRPGQVLFYENGQGIHHWRGQSVEITKVGREYGYLKNGLRFSLNTGEIISDYTLGNLWYSQADYEKYRDLREKWFHLRRIIDGYFGPPDHLNAADIDALIVKITASN